MPTTPDRRVAKLVPATLLALTALTSLGNFDVNAMAEAINQTREDMDYDNEWDLFHLLVENKPISSLMTHSYGFHTANGRNIIETIKSKYYEYEKEEY